MSSNGSAGALTPPQHYLDALAQLAVEIGANIQAGQVVGLSMESGQEDIVRAVAERAYAAGAKFVDVSLFDPFVKHSRLKHADRDTLNWVPSWLGERTLALGELHGARMSFQGPAYPHLMDDIDPERLGLDMLPRLKESATVVNAQQCNWTIVPFPVPGWAELVHPELPLEQAYAQLWADIADICRLDEPDPAAAWLTRLESLEAKAGILNGRGLDKLHFFGPGTDLHVGLMPSTTWIAGRSTTASGIVHVANIPTEEVFTTPDPTRVDGVVRSTKPLMIPGAAPIEGLQVRFEQGRAVQIDADKGAEILRGMAARDEGASRLGEVALVDRESRIHKSGRIFYSILLDENAACHIALGSAYAFTVKDEQQRERVNKSQIHIDFMIGSDEVSVDGITADGHEVALLRGGVWQV
jgi:aminopeptidase